MQSLGACARGRKEKQWAWLGACDGAVSTERLRGAWPPDWFCAQGRGTEQRYSKSVR